MGLLALLADAVCTSSFKKMVNVQRSRSGGLSVHGMGYFDNYDRIVQHKRSKSSRVRTWRGQGSYGSSKLSAWRVLRKLEEIPVILTSSSVRFWVSNMTAQVKEYQPTRQVDLGRYRLFSFGLCLWHGESGWRVRKLEIETEYIGDCGFWHMIMKGV